MGYVAGKRMQIRRVDGTYEVRQPGEPVPEAAGWKNLDAWLHQGSIKLVPDGAPKAVPKQAETKAAPQPEMMEVVITPPNDTPKKKTWKRKPQ